jgi:arginase family enzyme
MPFVDLTTFVRQPACPDWGRLDGTDVAVLGIPINTASSYRVGARFAPMRPLGTLIESFRSSADIRLMAPPLPAASRRSESE